MIDTTPQPDTTYKFAKVDMSAYFHVNEMDNVPHWVVTTIGPDVDTSLKMVLDKLIRGDLLPDWVHEYMRTLDVAGSGHSVPGVGKKIGSVYWINVTDEI